MPVIFALAKIKKRKERNKTKWAIFNLTQVDHPLPEEKNLLVCCPVLA